MLTNVTLQLHFFQKPHKIESFQKNKKIKKSVLLLGSHTLSPTQQWLDYKPGSRTILFLKETLEMFVVLLGFVTCFFYYIIMIK